MSSDVILSVENVSKLYRLGTVGTGTFGGDVQRFWKTKVLGQEDPFMKIGQTNDRTSKEKADFVWALQDINFEVKRGEVLGIIGKNGAGKSTLLKLLSRITAPTTGRIRSAGRMASLLEVGTGFHPELTGRENIFLNGAILGMTKREIQSKFDEIVDFSGCELYIDTPVKRYSSGMTVRLGFAVAAFLDPEILVVDEVLAVGDAEFQKKAIGKMKDASSKEGKTVLFVSHNMDAVRELCTSAVYLMNGKLYDMRSTMNVKQTIDFYLGNSLKSDKVFKLNILNSNLTNTKIKSAQLNIESALYEFDEDIILTIHIEHYKDMTLSIVVLNKYDSRLLIKEKLITEAGYYTFQINKHTLLYGDYYLKLYLSIPNQEIFQETSSLEFGIKDVPCEFMHYSNQNSDTYPFGYFYSRNSIVKEMK